VSDPRATGGDSGSTRSPSQVSVARPELDLTVAAEVESLPGLRRSVTDWLAVHDLVDPDLGSVHVVLSELVANAIEASRPGEQVDVHLGFDHDVLTVEVRNPSTRHEPVAIPPMADPLSPRGRGLAIVGSLTEHLDLAEVDRHTVATATLRLNDRARRG
jgi:anti-sigma regulatory factor (Ser/Thr protein kinase)